MGLYILEGEGWQMRNETSFYDGTCSDKYEQRNHNKVITKDTQFFLQFTTNNFAS